MTDKDWIEDHFLGLTPEERVKAKELRDKDDKRRRRSEVFWHYFKKITAIILLLSFVAVVLDYFSVVPIGIFHRHHRFIVENDITVEEETVIHRELYGKPLATNNQIFQLSRLRNGVDLMTREYNEAEAEAVGWRRFYATSAARLNALNDTLNNVPMTAYQYNQTINDRNGAEADYDNSRRRLKELTDKEESLNRRIGRARVDIENMMESYRFP